MAEKVSRQTGHCRAGDAGLLGLLGLLLCEATGEAEGESVRSMVISSSISGLSEAFW